MTWTAGCFKSSFAIEPPIAISTFPLTYTKGWSRPRRRAVTSIEVYEAGSYTPGLQPRHSYLSAYGRTPWSAADALVGFLKKERVQGDPRGPGGPPHFRLHYLWWASGSMVTPLQTWSAPGRFVEERAGPGGPARTGGSAPLSSSLPFVG